MSVCVVNLATIDPEANGGLSRVAKELSRVVFDLSLEQPAFHPVFAVGEGFASRFAQWFDWNPTIIPIDPMHPGRPLLRGLNPDLILSPLFGMEPFDQIREFDGVRHIAVMPDTLALDLPQTFTARVRARRRQSYQLLKQAYRVITLSEYARSQLLQHLQLAPESVAAIHLGADSIQPGDLSAEFIDVPRPYLFYPANTWLHKRHDLALRTFRLLLQERPDLQLVLTGGRVAEFGIDLDQLIAQTAVPAGQVHDLGYVTDAQMVSLYSHAEALLFTSAYEGFGMPILEAMRLGCPVVCAPVTAIPETAGDAALYVDSEDPQCVGARYPYRTAAAARGVGRAWSKTHGAV